MKDFELEYDAKAHSFTVSHNNILKQQAKDYEETLVIKPFQISVQVTVDKDVRVANPDAVDTEMQTLADELEAQVHKEIGDLDGKIQKLKKEEDAGKKTASAEADKLVKQTKKKLEKLAGEFGGTVRVAIEKELTRQNRGGKVKGRSASRTIFRDLELNDDFFDEESGSEQSDPYIGKLAQELAANAKEIFQFTLEEKSVRGSLGEEIQSVEKAIEAYKLEEKKDEVDIKQFVKDNSKDVSGLVTTAHHYIDFITLLSDRLEAASKSFDTFAKLIDHAENMDDQKEIEKQAGIYSKALKAVQGTIDEKLAAGKAALRLLKDEYKTGDAWTTLEGTLDGIKAAAKSAGLMKDSGAALVKLSKK